MKNPPAFPIPFETHNDGMTLRDYFAAKAMQPLITASVTEPGCVGSADNISKCAYQFADAMLKARGA